MKTINKIKFAVLLLAFSGFLYSCSSTSDGGTYTKVNEKNTANVKSGAQLWGENCTRCHSTPSPAAYNDTDWETIGMHMRIRANLTKLESEKIFEFLKSAN